MKKTILPKVFFFAILMSFCETVCAQLMSGVTSAKETCDVVSIVSPQIATLKNCIMRSHYQNAALTYYEQSIYDPSANTNTEANFFLYNHQASSAYRFKLPDDVHVLDFEQLDSSPIVAFCGYKTDLSAPFSEVAVIGWFTPTTGSSINIYCVTIPELSRVTRITPLMNTTGEYYCAAIGRMYLNPGWQSVIVRAKMPNLVVPPYQVALFPVRYGEVLWDIVKTEKHIVFIGSDCTERSMCLRKEKQNDFINSMINDLNNIYCYEEPDGDANTPWTGTFLGNELHRTGENIATGGPLTDNNQQIWSRYRVFDITTMNNTHAQQFPLYTKIETLGLTYLHSSDIIASLQGADPENGDYKTTVMLLKPYPPLDYSTNAVQDPERHYFSIDNLNQSSTIGNHFLLGGFAPNGLSWFLKNSSSVVSPNGCNDIKPFDIKVIPTVPTNVDTDILNVISPIHEIEIINTTVDHLQPQPYIYCFD